MIVALAVGIAMVILWASTAFNRVRELSDDAEEAWDRMGTHVNRRHDLASQLIDELRDVVDFERELLDTLEHVTSTARDTMARAGTEHGVRTAARAQGALSEILAHLKVTLARYPDWHPRRRIPALLQDISATEAAAGDALRAYNQTAQDLLEQCDRPVWSIVARLADVPRVELWTDLAHTSSGPAPALREHETAQE